jgi:hypothetical protein
MKYTFKKAEEKLLSLGFSKIEDELEDYVEIFGTYGINYCPYCKKGDVILCLFKQSDENLLEFRVSFGGIDSGNVDLTFSNFNHWIKEIKDYGLI